MADDTLQIIGEAVSAMAGLGLASAALVDASKIFWGGVSNIGFGHIRRACQPFAKVLASSVGDADAIHRAKAEIATWQDVLLAQWRNGRDKEKQKALVRQLVRLGITNGETHGLAEFCGIDAGQLKHIAARLHRGDDPGEQRRRPERQVSDDADPGSAEGAEPADKLLGRIDAIVGYQIDAAYERADQQYRNFARVSAGVVASFIGVGGAWLVHQRWELGLIAGVLSVPIAPIAKDLMTALSSSVSAAKALKQL